MPNASSNGAGPMPASAPGLAIEDFRWAEGRTQGSQTVNSPVKLRVSLIIDALLNMNGSEHKTAAADQEIFTMQRRFYGLCG